MVILPPLHLAVDEVVIGETQSCRLEVTLFTVGIKMVLGLGAVPGAIVEELGCCAVLIFHLFACCVGLTVTATDLELRLLACVRCTSLLSLP